MICGKGFLAFSNENVRLCKKQCAIKFYGDKWKPGMFVSRRKPNKIDEMEMKKFIDNRF